MTTIDLNDVPGFSDLDPDKQAAIRGSSFLTEVWQAYAPASRAGTTCTPTTPGVMDSDIADLAASLFGEA